MRSDWVAASVRARSMAQRRAGAGTCRDIAAAHGLQPALERLTETSYGTELSGARTVAEAHQGTRRAVLWQLRVLAGWLPAGGARLVRSAAAVFEANNILALDLRLHREQLLRQEKRQPPQQFPRQEQLPHQEQFPHQEEVPHREQLQHHDRDRTQQPFELGGLATAWPRIRTAATVEELRSTLAASPWGDPGPDSALSDVLTVVWLRRLTSEAPAARSWAASAGVLICARLVLVDRVAPGARLLTLLRPLIGTTWSSADTLETLKAALPPGAARVLDGVQLPTDLWRAEASLAARVEADGFSLLRAGLPGPDVVLGAMAVLAADAWRVRAALAAAAAKAGNSEVLDAVA